MPARRLDVTLVNQYFPPDRAATAPVFADLMALFRERGHRVRVICGRPSYRPTSQRSWRMLTRERWQGLDIERVGSAAFDRQSLSRRLANYGTFLALALGWMMCSRRSDVVICGSDPPLAILIGLAGRRGAKLIYHLQDLHPEAAVAAGWIPDGAAARVWESLHRVALRRADLVICIAEEMAVALREKSVSKDRVIVVPNGAAPPSGPIERSVVADLRKGADFVVMHAGNLGVAGPWAALAEAARLVGSDVDFVFVGDGSMSRELGDSVRLEAYRDSLASVMHAGDLQIVTTRSDMEGLVMPSKFYSALAHGRPVLAVVPNNSEVARTVERWKCGVHVEPDDPHAIANAVLELRDDPRRVAAMAQAAAQAGAVFDRRRLFDSIVKTTEGLARTTSELPS
jgi:colanic acid biosynthesis glycosyl transferase WcaI